MIFVTVGTDQHDFSRLVRKMDEIAGRKGLPGGVEGSRRVVMQIGWTEFEPRNAEWFRFESNRRIEELYRKADIIVTHGGAGSIINSLKNGKIPVVVPRMKAFKEHVNDHQLDLARSLGRKGGILLVEDVEGIEKQLRKRLARKREGGLGKRLGEYLGGMA